MCSFYAANSGFRGLFLLSFMQLSWDYMHAHASSPTCSCNSILLVHAYMHTYMYTHIIQQTLLLHHQEKDVKAKCTIHFLVGDCGTAECGWLKGCVPCVDDGTHLLGGGDGAHFLGDGDGDGDGDGGAECG